MRLLKALFLILVLSACAYAGDVSVTQTTILNWQKPAPVVYVFYSETFTASDGTLVPAGNEVNKNAYLRLTTSLIGTTLTIPSHTIKSTRDGLDNKLARVSYVMFTTAGAVITPNPLAPYTNMQVPATLTSGTGCSPAGTCGSLSELRLLNISQPPPPPPQYLDAETIQRMISAQLTGAPAGAMYILKSANGTLTNAFAMDTLGTGLVKNTAGVPSIGVAGTDFQAPIGVTSPLTFIANTVAIPVATSGANGYLSSTDWTTFNSKQAALGFTPENLANKNASNGYAGLSSGKITASQMTEVLAPADLTGVSGVQGTGATLPIGTFTSITNGQAIVWDSGTSNFINAAVGSVTSVALTVPGGFSVSGSPITSSGTLAVSFASGQVQNSVLATPDASTGALSIRTLVNGDLPVVNAAHGGSGLSSYTPHSILAAGTTGTGNYQQIVPATAGLVLTANGAGALPSFQALPAAVAHNLLGASHSDTTSSSPPSRGSLITAQGSGTASWTEKVKGTQYQTVQANATDTVFDAVHLDQAAAVTGTLPVASGGTGATTFTANAVLYGNGSGALQAVLGGGGTLCLQSTNGAAPVFGACSGSAATAWSSLTAPSGNLAVAHGTNTTVFTWSTGLSADALTLQDTTGSVSTNHILAVSSVGTSTMKPVMFTAKGTTNGVEMSSAGILAPIGTGGITANALNGVSGNGVQVRTSATNFTSRTHTDAPGITWTNPDGVSGDFSAALNLATLVANQTIWDGANTPRTLTFAVTGTDPVMSFAASSIDVTVGTLKQGGTPVVLESRTLTNGTGINTLGDLSANRTVSIDQSFSPTWTGIHTFTPALRPSGSAPYFTINAPADTGLTAGTEAIGVRYVGADRRHATGAIGTQREYVFQAPTYSFAGSSTVNFAATVAIENPPSVGSNATLSNRYSLWSQNGNVEFDGGRLIIAQSAPVFDLAANLLATSILLPLTSTVTVPSGSVYTGMRFSQADGTANNFTVGASGAQAIGVGVYNKALSGSDSSSALYSAVMQADNAGPGTVKALHVLATGVSGSTGILTGASFDVNPVTGQGNTFSVQVASSGINNVVRGIIFTTNGGNFNYGIDFCGFSTIPGYNTAAIRLPNNVWVNARAQDNGSDVNVIRLNATASPGEEIELGRSAVITSTNPYISWGTTASGYYAQFVSNVLTFTRGGVGGAIELDASTNFNIVNSLGNGQRLGFKSKTELTTIAAAATTDTAITLPANAVILSVDVRVTVAIPTAATFTVTGTTSGTTFNTAAVSTALNTTDVGTKAGAFYNATSQTIRITPNLTPATNAGRVRVTVHYYEVTAATS